LNINDLGSMKLSGFLFREAECVHAVCCCRLKQSVNIKGVRHAGLLDVAIDGIRGHAEAQRAVAAADSAAQAANVHVGDYGEVDHWIWAAGSLMCVD
jgi:hypothetical protein